MKKVWLYTSLLILTLTNAHSSEWCDTECAKKYGEYAELSKEVYAGSPIVNEWERIKDYSQEFCPTSKYGRALGFGRIREVCSDFVKIGLHLSVYQNTKTKKYVIVIEGTQPTDVDDLLTDIVQLTNVLDAPKQYKLAREYVEKLISDGVLDKEAIITGHSLGGGIAQYVAKSFGMDAYTFNPAGLSSSTLDDAEEFFLENGYNSDSFIFHIISNNNRGQRDLVSDYGILLGSQKFMYVNKNNLLDLHSIDNLSEALDKSKEN